ncbi:vitamin K epoxide reductase family protein [Fontisphaera persica]|uniref:vitamin K epoxide reductase family protein n=1 Tax=Fontisphaera persica TaxID=2974023 RepID=UPI0024BF7041|nr:vitamin K epoxide reductase family protein [Fontisphaera persica]WCJ60576.1 vitamin K epoxide reductase family protein [Fontisphaera persica]
MRPKKAAKSSGGQSPAPSVESDAFATSWHRTAIRGLLAVAMASALYLLYVSLSGGAVAGCGPDSGCDRVLRSRWAYWLGIPVSAPAFLAYGTLFTLLTLYPRHNTEEKQRLWAALLVVSVLVVGAATWFVGLMLFVIDGLCPFCLAAHGSAVAAAIWVLRFAPIQAEPKSPHKKQKLVYLAPSLARCGLAAGLAGVCLLVGGQLAFKKSGHVIKSLGAEAVAHVSTSNAPPPLPQTNAATAAPTAQAITAPTVPTGNLAVATPPPPPPSLPPSNVNSVSAIPRKGRIITTHQGAFRFNLDEVPLFGSADAPFVIVSLFDYTCHHCHIMHAHLQTALQYFSNRLAIISLPMPLDSTCNPLVRRTHPTASNACVYARLGLAVWRANRERFRQFDDFMFSRPVPPPVSEASDYAANLVGADALGRALADPWIEERLRTSISLYHTNALILGTGAMPQLVLGNKAVSGSLNSPGELIRILNENLIKP